MNSMMIFDLLFAGCGVYLIYMAILMKKQGVIKQGVIVSQDVDINKIRDKEGFINYMYGKELWMGILTLLVGVVSLLNNLLGGPVYVTGISIILYLVVLVVFAVISTKARKKFID